MSTYDLQVINGTEISEVLNGTQNNDLIFGYGGYDILAGLEGNDTLYGDGSNPLLGAGDQLFGGSGDDILWGGPGSDFLHGDDYQGGTGNDILIGSDTVLSTNLPQVDYLTGGLGSDIFVLGGSWGVSYQYYGNADYATIIDWDYQTDYIGVSESLELYSLGTGYCDGDPNLPDTGIYYGNELIGLILDSTEVNIARDFLVVT